MIEILVLVVILIIVFALIGFISSFVWLARGVGRSFSSDPHSNSNNAGANSSNSPMGEQPSLSKDVASANRLIDHLRTSGAIDEETHRQFQLMLSQALPQLGRTMVQPAVARPAEVRSEKQNEVDFVAPDDGSSQGDKAKSAILLPQDSPDDSVVIAEVISNNVSPQPVTPIQKIASATAVASMHASAVINPSTPAPWDVPDPPPRAPRRSLAEWMAGFMQEKNMRWGELTSGILIVLSAVGLVVSLQEELSNTIPYFSSLMFLLLTTSIIGAGVYTLKKWKLQSTSRGTLIIGLLLIPLNFVAACILSGGGDERRAFDDPLLWTAIALGVTCFAGLAWWASKNLLRKGFLPPVIVIAGCGAATLLINRTIIPTGSQLSYLFVALPAVLFFLAGTCTISWRQWTRERWNERSTNRLFLILGVASFAFLVSLSLVIVRASSPLAGLVAMTPIFSLACLVIAWMGSIVRQKSIGAFHRSHRLCGYTLQILGLILVCVSIILSASNPTILAINSFLSAAVVATMATHQRIAKIFPFVWGLVAIGVLASFHLLTGNFGFDQWVEMDQIRSALLNSKSGLCLLGVGSVIFVAHWMLNRRSQEKTEYQKSLDKMGWYSGCIVLFAGSGLAVGASFLNRNNVFDAMTASSLLLLFAAILITVCIRIARRNSNAELWLQQLLPNAAAFALLCGLAHALLWNTTIGSWFNTLTPGLDSNWVIVFSVLGSCLTALIIYIERHENNETRDRSISIFSAWAIASVVISGLGALVYVSSQTGFSTVVELVAAINWFFVGWVWIGRSAQWKKFVFVPFVVSTAVALCVFISEIASRYSWCPNIDEPRHWLIQMVALAAWSVVWVGITFVCQKSTRGKWLSDGKSNAEQFVLYGLSLVVGYLAVVALSKGVVQQLGGEAQYFDQLSIYGESAWMFASIGAIGLAMLFTVFIKPTASKGAALVCLWLLAWSWGAVLFEPTHSVASAIRWLLPIGGALGAVLIAGRKLFGQKQLTENESPLPTSESERERTIQKLINLGLAIVAGIVLVVSTATVSQVLIFGVESLGGPLDGSWFARLRPDVSFAIPITIIVGTFLLFAISERRPWLATLGSCVFQYVVLLAVVLLFLSPHPKIASTWFINILQAVSLGMTAYGFVWFWMRNRIETGRTQSTPTRVGWNRVTQMEAHTFINGLLITSLAVVAMGQFFLFPTQPGGWVNSIGGVLGIAAWLAYMGLAWNVWREKFTSVRSHALWNWTAGWVGLIIVSLLAATVDRYFRLDGNHVDWATFNVIAFGMLLVSIVQACLAICFDKMFVGVVQQSEPDQPLEAATNQDPASFSWMSANVQPALMSVAIGLLFAFRGVWANPAAFWFYILGIGAAVLVLLSWAAMSRNVSLGVIATVIASAASTVVVWRDPQNWFTQTQPYLFNLLMIVIGSIAIVWTGFMVYRQRKNDESFPTGFAMLPGIYALMGVSWLFVAALGQLAIDMDRFGGANPATSMLANPLGIVAIFTITGLVILSVLNRQNRFLTSTSCGLSMALAIFLTSTLVPIDSWRLVGVNLAASFVVTLWGVAWLNRKTYFRFQQIAGIESKRFADDNTPVTEPKTWQKSNHLPTYSVVAGTIVLILAFVAILVCELRSNRYTAAMVPFMLAVGIGLQSNGIRRRWMQTVTLALATVGFLFVAWADLTPAQIFEIPALNLAIRSLIVLATAVFVYGALVTRWVAEDDSWLKSLRGMAIVTCGLAAAIFLVTVVFEWQLFQWDVGCGLSVAESVGAAILVLGMIAGLIIFAVRPKNDPFSLSIEGRMGYIYAAQFVAACLVAHLYFTMPWLFKLGVKEYWPYIAMAVCFGGIGIGRMLEKRDLVVLGKPLFQTAIILPLAVAVAVFAIESKADLAMVMLSVGFAYFMIGTIRQATWGIAAAFLFGNLALWVFFYRFPEFSIFEHPQLWLIPPAVSALIAGHMSREFIPPKQLTTLRYVCAAVIYISSTMEIFISGIGGQLWPPVVLAILSVTGIMLGMALRIKSFLYFGSLFLMMAMISMVSLAHQRLDHVWPWWAFGIGLGIAILVMFGLFEKRKNDLRAIAHRLKNWEA